jgi:1,4-dihydroxy-2-naphthoate octaprenyltransferase
MNEATFPQNFPWLLFILYFIFILAITLPFDIRDIYLDEATKKTIPQRIGEANTRILSALLLVGQLVLIYQILGQWPVLYTFFTGLSIFLIFKSKSDTNDLYFSFVIDGLLILQGLTLYYECLFFI